jgi:site-specific recombinase XerD
MARRVPEHPTPAPPSAVPVRPGVGAALDLVLCHWFATGTHSTQSQARMGETAVRFQNRLRATGIGSFTEVTPVDAAAFINAPTRTGRAPQLATRHNRRTSLRAVYRTLRELGLADGDPTLDVGLPARGELVARPLTEAEVTLGRTSVHGRRSTWSPMRATAWALGEASAVSSEITRIRISDLDHPTRPRHVTLPGTPRHDQRTVELTPWGRRILTRRVAELTDTGHGPNTLLAYGGAATPGGATAQASVCNALRDVLHLAGLGTDPQVKPGSLRHWAGRSRYDAGAPLTEVARVLGHRSLDETALDIGLHWHTTTATTTTAPTGAGAGVAA